MKVQKNFLVRRCLEIGLSGTMEALVAIVSAVSFILEGLSIGVVAQLVLVHIAARSFAEIPAETVSGKNFRNPSAMARTPSPIQMAKA